MIAAMHTHPNRRATLLAGLTLAGLFAALGIQAVSADRQSGSPVAAQSAGRSAAIDELFRQWNTPTTPGAAVLVIDRGEIVHARGYGMANLEHGVPIRPETVFDIASLSKQFGAMAIALLESDRKLSLDDDVRKYVPELPDFGERITLRHLVHHTSGLRDWPGTLAVAGWNYQDVLSFNQILRMVYNQRELNFKPGDAYAYSNTGYNVLAEVVARVSGRSFRQFCDERIFTPLGMTSTHFHDDHTEVVRGRAESYRPAINGRYHHVPSSLTAVGSSSLFTTVNDLAKWITNLHAAEPRVGGRAVVARLHEQGRLNSGETVAYAFGQSIGNYRGIRSVAHTGSWAGYRTVLQRVPDEGFAVVILSNTAEMNPTQIAREITDVYLGSRVPAPAAAAAGPGRAGLGGAAGGAVAWNPTPDDLQVYTGVYTSAELMTSYSLIVRDGQLIGRHFRTGDVLFKAMAADRFQAGPFGEVRFLKDGAGRVIGFTANSDRVRNLRFDRTNK